MVIPESADVIVVGGGPAGSSTATHLARAGVDVLLIDKATFPREKACAEYCSPGVVDALGDLGALDRVLAQEHCELPAMQVVARTEEIPLTFAQDRPDGNPALGIRRSILDHELLKLAEESGVRVEQGTRVTGPVVEDNRVAGVRCRSGRSEHEVRADFVVAADGLHSTISRALDNDRPVRWPRRLGLVARFAAPDEISPTGQMHIGDGIYCGLSPVGPANANVSLVVPMGSKPHGEPTGEFFDRTIRQIPGIARLLSRAERTSRVRGLGPMGKRVRSTVGNGYLLVGDAAGFFDPLTGEGIHRALRGGELAARAALAALSRKDRFPIGYSRSRKEEFNDKERVCRIIQGLLTFPPALTYAARRASQRSAANRELCGILGDYRSARRALYPSFLWHVFRP